MAAPRRRASHHTPSTSKAIGRNGSRTPTVASVTRAVSANVVRTGVEAPGETGPGLRRGGGRVLRHRAQVEGDGCHVDLRTQRGKLARDGVDLTLARRQLALDVQQVADAPAVREQLTQPVRARLRGLESRIEIDDAAGHVLGADVAVHERAEPADARNHVGEAFGRNLEHDVRVLRRGQARGLGEHVAARVDDERGRAVDRVVEVARLQVEQRGGDHLAVRGGPFRDREVDTRGRRRRARLLRRRGAGRRAAEYGRHHAVDDFDSPFPQLARASGTTPMSKPMPSVRVRIVSRSPLSPVTVDGSDGRGRRVVPSSLAIGPDQRECGMFEWPEELQMVRDAVRQFVDNEIRPHREELEHGDLPPYDLLRKLYKTFGMDPMAADSFDRASRPRRAAKRRSRAAKRGAGGGGGGFTLLPIIELCKCSPGMVTAMGVSVGLTAAAIKSKGTIAQKKRWARDILTLDKIGAWAITEPNSGLRRVRLDGSRPRAATATSTC